MPASHNPVHKTPFVRILIPLASGILLYDRYPSFLCIIVPLVVSLLLFAIAWRRDFDSRFYSKPFFGAGLLFFFLGIGAFLTQLKSDTTQLELSGNVTLTGKVGETPLLKNGYYRFVFLAEEVQTPGRIYTKPVRVMTYLKSSGAPAEQKIRTGEGLRFTGRYIPSDSVEVRNGFDYGLYLKHKGIAGICFVYPRNLVVQEDTASPYSFYVLMDRWREFLLGKYSRLGLSYDNYAVLASLALGSTNLLPDEQKESYAESGLAHVLAISGMHIAILYAVLSLLFGLNRKSTKPQLLRKTLLILFLWLFAFLSGSSPSAFRATFMFSLFLAGEMLGRRVSSYNILFAVGAFMLLLNPYYLFDVSFLLSFGALASILYFDPLLKRGMETKNAFLLYFRDIVTMSTAAQIGVLPLLLRYFGSFSLLFPLANLFALPAFPLLLFLAWAYLPLSLFGIFDPFFHDVLTLLLDYMNGVARITALVPYSHLNTGVIPLWVMVALYAAIGGVIYSFQKKGRV